MLLEIITPEKKLFAGKADAVQLPGKDGSFQVLNGHAPIISALAKGNVKIDLSADHKTFDGYRGTIQHDPSKDKVLNVEINGGTVELLNNKMIVLAE